MLLSQGEEAVAYPLVVLAVGITSIFLTLICHKVGNREEEDVGHITTTRVGQTRARDWVIINRVVCPTILG